MIREVFLILPYSPPLTESEPEPILFGRKITQPLTLMQLAQTHGPGANRTQAWPGLLCCGMLMVLHAVLVSDGQLKQAVVVLLTCHIGA